MNFRFFFDFFKNPLRFAIRRARFPRNPDGGKKGFSGRF